MNFKNGDGQEVSLSDICSLISNDYEYQVFVGTDSQVRRKKKCVLYATCVVLYKKGKGGRIFVAAESQQYANSLKERLMNEVWRSLMVSFELSKILPSNVEIIVHIDTNRSTKYKSGLYTHELVSLVTGQGYKCKIKPDSWAAQHVANHYTKK